MSKGRGLEVESHCTDSSVWTQQHDVFVSYHWDDTVENLSKIKCVVDRLRRHGYSVCLVDSPDVQAEVTTSRSSCRPTRSVIEASHCVIICLTSSYISKLSENDQNSNVVMEFDCIYGPVTVSLSCHSKPVVVIQLNDMPIWTTWPGAAGVFLSGQRRLDFSGRQLLSDPLYQEECLKDLLYVMQVKLSHILLNDVCNGEDIGRDVMTVGIFHKRRGVTKEQRERVDFKGTDTISTIDSIPLGLLDVSNVKMLLRNNKLSKYIDIFRINEVDGETLAACENAEDIQQLGVDLLAKSRVFFNKLKKYKLQGGIPRVDITPCLDEPICDTPGADTTLLEKNTTHEVVEVGNTSTRKDTANAECISEEFDDGHPSCLTSLLISGCTGDRMHDINGIFDPTGENQDGFVRYKKRAGQNVYLEYNATRGHWHCKKGESRGTVNAWGYVLSSCVEPSLITNTWQIFNGVEFVSQHHLTIRRIYFPILVAGGNGLRCKHLNGMFDPVEEETCGGWIRYRKRGDSDHWLEYCAENKQWHIKPSSSKSTTHTWAYIACPHVCAPSNIFSWIAASDNDAGGKLTTRFRKEKYSWQVFNDGTFMKCPEMMAIAEPYSIKVLGGPDYMNGKFNPVINEVCNGYIRYKHEEKDLWMEYCSDRGQWHMKPAKNKGTTFAWAYATYKDGGYPDLTHTEWYCFSTAKGFTKESGILIIKYCQPIRISNASGNVGNQVNGIFDPTDEICGEWIRYKKRGERENVWMEYFAEKGQWHVKPTSSKLTTNAWAYATCKPAMAPTEVTDCWKLYDGSKFVDFSSVTITVVDTGSP